MLDEEKNSFHKSFSKIDEIQLNDAKNIKIKNLSNKSDDIEDENYSYKNLFFAILKQMIVLTLIMAISSVRRMILLVFSRNQELSLIKAVSTIIPLYTVFNNGITWACSQYLGYIGSYYYGKKEYRNLGLATNKTILYNLVISIIVVISFFFIIPIIFTNFFEDPETVSDIDSLSKMMSLAIPLQFIQFIMNMYFFSTKFINHLPYSQIIGLVVQILLQVIIILGFGNHLVGIGVSNGMGQLFVVLFNLYYYIFNNPNKETYVPFNYLETIDNFENYVKASFPIGLIIFLNFISNELLQFMSILLGETIFTCYSILTIFNSLVQTINKSLSTTNNFELNRALGANKYKYYKRILLTSLIIVTAYSIVFSIIVCIFFESIMSLFTTNLEILDTIIQFRFVYSLLFFTDSFIFYFGESLTCFKNNRVPLMNLLIFRYFGTIVLGLCFFYFSVGAISFMLSFLINNIFIISVNAYFLINEANKAIVQSKKQCEA